jgi:hypothetical protein
MTERDIFIAALHQSDPAERAAFLDRACADARPLRDRIEALLHEQEQLGSFLEQHAEGLGGTRDCARTRAELGKYPGAIEDYTRAIEL